MNKIEKLLLIAMFLMCSVIAYSQVKVNSSGILQVGSTNINNFPPVILLSEGDESASANVASTTGSASYVSSTFSVDSTASINVFGRNSMTQGAHISFGTGKMVGIGSCNVSGLLWMRGMRGITYEPNDTTTVFKYLTNGAFNFYCDVRSTGVFITSDSRLKRNVKSIGEEDVESLSMLTPVTYELTKSKSESVGTGQKYGFLAQEIQQYYPELVSEDEDGYLSVDYIGFIPLLVEKVNTLQSMVDEQREIIENLENPDRQQRQSSAGVDSSMMEVTVSKLYQNNPNPFNMSTDISYELPQSVRSAALYVYDLQGKQLMKFDVAGGAGKVTIASESLTAGMYIYTLVADGVEVGSKRMILTD